MKWALAAVLLVAACSNANAQNSADGVLKSGIYSSSELGFRYAAPAAMRDTTASARAQIEARVAASHRRSSSALLLAMTSGPDDTASDWHSMGIETFARASWPDADDFHAESLMKARRWREEGFRWPESIGYIVQSEIRRHTVRAT